MKDFSIVGSALAGFRLIAKRPLSFLSWYAIWLVYLVGFTALGTYMAGEAFQVLDELQRVQRETGETNVTTMMQVAGQTGPYSLIGMVLRIAVTVFVSAAVLRVALNPARKGLTHLRLSGDEFRLLMVTVVVMVIMIAAMLAGFILTIVLGLVGGGVARAVDALPTAAIALGAVGLGGAITVCGYIFLMVKFMFAQADTMAGREMRFFNTWTLTKGRFWKLLATFAVTLLALAPFAAICAGGAVLAAGDAVQFSEFRSVYSYLTVPPFTPADLFTPARMIFFVLMGALIALSTTVFLAMPAAVYRQITDEVPATGGSADEKKDDVDWDDENIDWDEAEWEE